MPIIIEEAGMPIEIELSNERIEEILHKETGKTEELTTILRGIYQIYAVV